MFRRLEKTLPPDPTYPADMEKLGYFITEDGHIRKIARPEQDFQFHLTNNERHNEVHREAIQICTRHEVNTRLAALGLSMLYLPGLTTTKPEGPHVPILAPPKAVLRTRKRIIVLINDSVQDLGILAYRQLQRELGINGGSMVNFVKEIIKRSRSEADERADLFKDKAGVDEKDAPGLVVLNTGQLQYSYKYNSAMTSRSWLAMPRKSIIHDAIKDDLVKNRVEGNRTPEEHIKYVFEHVIKNSDFVNPDAEVYVVGLQNGGEKFLWTCDADWPTYATTITAMAFVYPTVSASQLNNPEFKAFLRKRARAWVIAYDESEANDLIDSPFSAELEIAKSLENRSTTSDTGSSKEGSTPHKAAINWFETVPSPSTLSTVANGLVQSVKGLVLGDPNPTEGDTTDNNKPNAVATANKTPQPNDVNETFQETDDTPICPTFSGGDTSISECIFTNPDIHRNILDFFEDVAQDPVHYQNPRFIVPRKEQPEPTEDFDGFETFKVEEGVAVKGVEEVDGGELERKTSWVPVGVEGPKMEMGGVVVDENMVKGAGLLDEEEDGGVDLDWKELLKGKGGAVGGGAKGKGRNEDV